MRKAGCCGDCGELPTLAPGGEPTSSAARPGDSVRGSAAEGEDIGRGVLAACKTGWGVSTAELLLHTEAAPPFAGDAVAATAAAAAAVPAAMVLALTSAGSGDWPDVLAA